MRNALIEFVHRIAVERIRGQRLRAEPQIAAGGEIAIAQAVVVRIEAEAIRVFRRESAHMTDADLHAEIAPFALPADTGTGRSVVVTAVLHRCTRTGQLARENLDDAA